MADHRHLNKLSEGVKAWNTWRKQSPEIVPDLRKADLHGQQLNKVDFRRTLLDHADLRDARLCSARLDAASLYQTLLTGAHLRHAHLLHTSFKETQLDRANVHEALLLDTAFLNVDLSTTLNLETLVHLGPSTLGLDTLQRSRGKLPDGFLLNIGVSEPLLSGLRLSGRAPFDYCTCFISYASRDHHFATLLYRDLRKAGVLCWYAPEHLKAGELFQTQITEAIQSREKLLVVLSRSALQSKWVAREVALARQREGKGKRSMLVPICLDSAILQATVGWAVHIRNHRHIRSFEQWQQPSRYQKVFADLLDDLHK